MKPALTPEEWRDGYVSEDLTVHLRSSMSTPGYRVGVRVKAYPLGGGAGDPQDLHALAALCLHGQPFGFWSELPKTLRIAAQNLRVLTDRFDDWGDLETAADRIEALLPPAALDATSQDGRS